MTQGRGEFQENSQSVSVLIKREAKKIIVGTRTIADEIGA